MVKSTFGMGGEYESSTPSDRRLTARVEGHVQGVGFRYSTVALARRFSIGGYVQNLPDGDVRVVAEGPEPELLKFMDALRSSHVYRYVRKEQLSWSVATGEFAGFDVRYA